MKIFQNKDKELTSLIKIFTDLAKDIYQDKEGGKIYQESTINKLPVRINVVWGNYIVDEGRDDVES